MVVPSAAANGVATALCPLFYWLLVNRLGLGLDGAALANSAVQITLMSLNLGYVAWRERQLRGKAEQTWHGWWVAIFSYVTYEIVLCLWACVAFCYSVTCE